MCSIVLFIYQYIVCAGANIVRTSKEQATITTWLNNHKNFPTASLDGSTAISFVLSAQCCSAQILDILNLVTSSGTSHFWETEIEPFPYNVLVNFLLPQNRCRSLRIYVALRDRKAVQVYASMLVLFDVWVLCAFWICSAPLSRLTPIEALPQTPQGLCPLTPQAL